MPSGKKHYRITIADALSAHQEALRRYGGRDGIHSLDLIESAIARPYSGYYLRIERKAAALLYSVANNHGFIDGNKRTAVFLLHVLLRRSDYALVLETRENIDDVVVAVVTGQMTQDALVVWFRSRIIRFPQPPISN